MKLYGIKNCDTVQKACKWLNQNGVTYKFYDYKKHSLSKELLEKWIKTISIENIINKRSTTYKKLSDTDKNNLNDITTAINIIIANPSIIKRPIIDTGKKLIVGFDIVEYKKYKPSQCNL